MGQVNVKVVTVGWTAVDLVYHHSQSIPNQLTLQVDNVEIQIFKLRTVNPNKVCLHSHR